MLPSNYAIQLFGFNLIPFHPPLITSCFVLTVLSVSPSAHRSARLVEDNGEPTIVFDNGQTYHLGEAIVTPHPPPEVLPLPPTSPAPTD